MSWDVEGKGPNADLFAAVGDTLTFNVIISNDNNIPHIFAIHNADDSRYPTVPAELTTDGFLTLTIGADAGSTLLYVCEIHPTTMRGRICIMPQNCAAVSECGGDCTSCQDGFELSNSQCTAAGSGQPPSEDDMPPSEDDMPPSEDDNCTLPENCLAADCSQVADSTETGRCTACMDGFTLNDTDNSCTSTGTGGGSGSGSGLCSDGQPLPDNCLQADCWDSDSGPQVQCTQCMDGFWLNSDSQCTPCSSCNTGEYISATCGGYTDTFCSPCTPCEPSRTTVTPCSGTGFTDSSECADRAFNCTPPENCMTADCWPSDTTVEIQCTLCNDGYWINPNLTCSQCDTCPEGTFMSYPCEGYTNTVCSPCYTEGCGPCQLGWTLALNGACTPLNCAIRGCGAANIGVKCHEVDLTHFLCTCPGENGVTVGANETFQGCQNLPPPSPEEVIANVNVTDLAANLVNGMIEIVGVAVVNVSGTTITLNITATVPIDTIGDQLKNQIAQYLGGDVTADDLTLEYTTKRADSGMVTVNLGGGVSSGNRLFYAVYISLLGLLLATL